VRINAHNLRLLKSNFSSALKHRTLTEDERNNLRSEWEIAEGNITLMIEERKDLENDVTHRQKLLGEKKKDLKKFKRKRRK
jgi:hypothetical protein